jgi:hypothetical protein
MNADLHREFLREIQQEMAGLSEKLRQLRSVADYHASKLGISIPAADEMSSPLPPLATNGHKRPATVGIVANRFKSASQREAAETIIREAGRPMRCGEIARTMVEFGYPRPDKMSKLTNSLFTSMTRDTKRFRKAGTGLFGLVDPENQEDIEEGAGS